MDQMSDCIYITTQEDLDIAEALIRASKAAITALEEFNEAVRVIADAFNAAIQSFEDFVSTLCSAYQEIENSLYPDKEVFQPQAQKRPQRKILLWYDPMLDERSWIYKIKRGI